MNKVVTTVKNQVLTGISYVFPVLVVVAVSQRLAALVQPDVKETATFLNTLVGLNEGIAELSLGLVFPILSGFIAFAIVDKIGLVPGFIGGLFVTVSQTGFLGAILMGFLVGYLCLALKQIKLPQAINSMMPVFILPVLGTVLPILLYDVIALAPLAWLNRWLLSTLSGLPLFGSVIGAVLIGGLISFDIGGPVNKLGMIIAFGLLTSGSYFANTAAQISIIIPPLGAAVATFLAKTTYSRELQQAGQRAWWMGLTGISEGAIPFRLENPGLTWVNVLGGALGSGVAVALGAVNRLPLSGFYAWPFVEGLGAYLIGIGIGTMTVGLVSLLGRGPVLETVEETFDEEEWDE